MSTRTIAGQALLPEVEAFLSKEIHGAVIGGQEMLASNGDTFETHDPGTGEKLATVANMQANDVEHAVAAAQKTFDEADWARLPVNERGVHLMRLADAVEQRKPIIAQIEALDCGKIETQAADDVQNFIDTIRYFYCVSQTKLEKNLNAPHRGSYLWDHHPSLQNSYDCCREDHRELGTYPCSCHQLSYRRAWICDRSTFGDKYVYIALAQVY